MFVSMVVMKHMVNFFYFSSKGATMSKRPYKKVEEMRNFEMRETAPEELDRNQKILQWMMEGEKEAGRYKKSPYG